MILWESLAGTHPFWGVPLPGGGLDDRGRCASAPSRRGDLPRRLLAAVDSRALGRSGQAADRGAARGRASRGVRRRRPATRPDRPRAPAQTTATRPRPREARRRRRGAARTQAGVCRVGGSRSRPSAARSCPSGLRRCSACSRRSQPESRRFARQGSGCALALAAPVLPLGNVAQAAAVVYGVARARVARRRLARPARRAAVLRSGPCSPRGLLALLPLAVQPARGVWRRALQAAVGVFAAAASPASPGRALPLGGRGCRRPRPRRDGAADGRRARRSAACCATNPEIATTALALAIVAAVLPRAAARGPWGIAALGALQLGLVLLWAPSIPALGFVVGTWLLCGALARPRPTSARFFAVVAAKLDRGRLPAQ